ncbi:MAG: Cupin 2, conserved barrel [Solirubrobacterales bacterium]|nr:Cupin 2, conserved barrel [Solirubrobacterales bacterium]
MTNPTPTDSPPARPEARLTTRAGDRFENPATRETGRILTGAGDTSGRYMQSETRVRPGGAVPVVHRHPELTERFEVLEGELTVRLDGTTRTLQAGEQVTIPPGAAHHYANTSDQDVVFRFDAWPAARFEAVVLTMFCLGMEGRTDDKGAPSPLQMAVILDEFDEVLQVVGPPRWLQRLLIPVLARLGRARGLRATYPHHREIYDGWQTDARAADLAEVGS